MKAADANALRATIRQLDAQHVPPAEIAAHAGCALSTVYKVLKAPGDDARAAPAKHLPTVPADVAGLIQTLTRLDPTLSAADVRQLLVRRAEDGDTALPIPSESTVTRVMRQLRARPLDATRPAEPVVVRVLPPMLDAYDCYRAADDRHHSLYAEIGLIRSFLRQTV